MEHNINVYVSGYAKTPIEFELSRNQHMKELPGRPFTVTALFKGPSPTLVPDAWRILMHAVRGRELLPTHVRDYCRRALANAGAANPDESNVLAAGRHN